MRDNVSLGNGFHVVNFRIPASLEGRELNNLDHDTAYNLRCIGVMRGSEYVGQDGSGCRLESADLLLLLGRRADLRSFAASL